MFRAYHKDHQAIILHLSLEKLALEGAFLGHNAADMRRFTPEIVGV